MSKFKVLYIDDEKDDLIIPLKNRLEEGDILKIDLAKPMKFEDQLDNLIGILKDFQGVILDLQLNSHQESEKGVEQFQVKYQAPPLAQMIRTLASENKIKDLPIILCSTENKIKASFNKDFTSHDLFDWTFLKDDLNNQTVNKIASFIEGYLFIDENKTNYSKILERDYDEIDERILSRFITEENPPNHEIARVIFKDIVQPTGVLINEQTLAARLGIDIEQSGEEWNSLLSNYFENARYKGVFNEAWYRWWNDISLDIFEEITGENCASVNANKRVDLLKEKTEFKNLVAAEPIKLNSSNDFWNICEITKKPIDPFEGYKINEKNEPKPWQDYSYVSLYAILEFPDKVSKNGIKVHPSDYERYLNDRKKLD